MHVSIFGCLYIRRAQIQRPYVDARYRWIRAALYGVLYGGYLWTFIGSLPKGDWSQPCIAVSAVLFLVPVHTDRQTGRQFNPRDVNPTYVCTMYEVCRHYMSSGAPASIIQSLPYYGIYCTHPPKRHARFHGCIHAYTTTTDLHNS